MTAKDGDVWDGFVGSQSRPTPAPAPAWRTTAWLNAPEPLELARLRGKVVLLHAFQMLCPACVAHGLPQAQRVARLFAAAPLAVVGLHDDLLLGAELAGLLVEAGASPSS